MGVVREGVTSTDSVEGELSWLPEHIIELDLLALSIAALAIALVLPFLNGHYVDMMGSQAKVALSVGVSCGLVGFFGSIVAYPKSKLLILAFVISLAALFILSGPFAPHL